MHPKEREALTRELSEYGTNTLSHELDISSEEFKRIREIASQVVQGNIDQQQVTGLNQRLKAKLDAMVMHLLSLQKKPGLRGLEERNPYYSPFNSNIVRDSRSDQRQQETRNS